MASIILLNTPAFIGLWTENEVKSSPAGDLRVVQPAAIERPPVEGCGLDIDVLRGIVLRRDRERAAFGVCGVERQRDLVEHRREHLKARIARAALMQPDGREDVPGG